MVSVLSAISMQYKKKGYKKKSVLKSEQVPELSNVITQQNG